MIRNPVFLYRVRAGALPPDTWRRTGRGAVLSAAAPALLTSEIWYEVSGESGECSMAAALPFSNCASTVLKNFVHILFPYALRCSSYVLLFYVYYADCICSPLFSMLILALVSLSCFVWHSGHSHLRIARFFTSGFLNPQQEHVWLLGYIVGTFTMSFPYQTDLYVSISKNLDHDAEPMCCASL